MFTETLLMITPSWKQSKRLPTVPWVTVIEPHNGMLRSCALMTAASRTDGRSTWNAASPKWDVLWSVKHKVLIVWGRNVTSAGENPSTDYGFSVIMMCQCRFLSCNKCTTLVGMLIVGKLCMCGQGAYRKSLYMSLNCAVNLELL